MLLKYFLSRFIEIKPTAIKNFRFILIILITYIGIIPVNAQVQHIRELQDTFSMGGLSEIVNEGYIKKGLVNNALEILSGQAAGVNIIANGSDRIAMLNSVRVRGTTSVTGGNAPLVIIDGVTSTVEALATVYPADIESFTILKNPSETALYGSRGASGIIEVKTKKGTGKGFEISYNSNFGVEAMYKQMEMLNGREYIATAKALGLDANDGGYNTDFQKFITRTGKIQNHHLAFSGGGTNSNYRASFGFMDHNSIVKNNDYRNLVAKLDVNQKALKGKLSGNFGLFGSYFKNRDIYDAHKFFYSAAAQNPTFSSGRDAEGNWKKNSDATHINHPGALLTIKDDQNDQYFNTHIRLTYDILPDLQLSAFGSYSFSSTENAVFRPTWVCAQGNTYRGEFKNKDLLTNVSLSYEHEWEKHKIEANLSGEYHKEVKTGFWIDSKGLASNDMGYNNIGASSLRPFGGSGSSYEAPVLASVMGSFMYRLKNKYSISLSARTDGSSMVGDNNTWGFFPSISASWDIKEEPFMKEAEAVSLLKLRSGYGLSGNLGAISAYTSLNTFKQNGMVSVDGTPTVTIGPFKNANSDLKWETKSTFNIALDMGFIKNRLLITAEYYYSKTRDMLYSYDVPVPSFTFDKLFANIGSMSNEGFEMGVSVTPLLQKDMELNINLNLSRQQNKLVSLSGKYYGMEMSAPKITPIASLDGAGQQGGDNNIVYQIVGKSLGVFYLPHCKGLKKDGNGHYCYELEDLDKNGEIDLSDGGDRYIAGQATPKLTLGSNISFRYKFMDISLQMNGAFGHKIFNGTGLSYTNMSSFPNYNVLKGAPKKNIVDQNVSDYWLESGNYLNFEYLTIGCNIPLKSNFVKSLRISANVNNLATITGYNGLTPMINSYVVNKTLGLDDKSSYPLYRTYSMGLSIQF